MEGRIINVRKLVALDIFLHGPRFIGVEFGLGTPAIIAFGLFVIYTGQQAIGAYIVLTGVNYIPLVIHTVSIIRAGSANLEIKEGMAADPHYVRKYSTQQLMIFVPLLILFLAAAQELSSRKREARPETEVQR